MGDSGQTQPRFLGLFTFASCNPVLGVFLPCPMLLVFSRTADLAIMSHNIYFQFWFFGGLWGVSVFFSLFFLVMLGFYWLRGTTYAFISVPVSCNAWEQQFSQNQNLLLTVKRVQAGALGTVYTQEKATERSGISIYSFSLETAKFRGKPFSVQTSKAIALIWIPAAGLNIFMNIQNLQICPKSSPKCLTSRNCRAVSLAGCVL